MRAVALFQGIYFFITGVWPLISIRTFQWVTGRKTDLWLVKTVGLLVAVVGLALLVAGFRGSVTFEIFLLAVGSSSALTAIDVKYSLSGVISSIYLLDAIAETVLAILWIRGLLAGGLF